MYEKAKKTEKGKEKMEIKISDKRENENNREYAYRVLRDNIMKLQLLPGTTINEGELAEQFGISRTPVHEAVIMLKEELLVEVYPQSGSKVSLIQLDILKEGHFLRSLIEPEIIGRLAGNITSEQVSKLRENLEAQKHALGCEDNIDMFFKLDDSFHHLIYIMAGKVRTWYAVKKVSTHYDRIRYLDAIMNHTELKNIYEQHKKIMEILLLGSSSDFDLKKFYDSHLGTYRKGFQRIYENYPDYFA